jgi:hypothetical protein
MSGPSDQPLKERQSTSGTQLSTQNTRLWFVRESSRERHQKAQEPYSTRTTQQLLLTLGTTTNQATQMLLALRRLRRKRNLMKKQTYGWTNWINFCSIIQIASHGKMCILPFCATFQKA